MLEGNEGWLNASTRIAAVDYVTDSGTSLEEVSRRLSSMQAVDSTGLVQIISSQQATIASMAETIMELSSSCSTASSQPRGGPLPAGSLVVAPGTGSSVFTFTTFPTIAGASWSQLCLFRVCLLRSPS